ncbi:MAG: SNF2-related protein [bacterium]
MANREFNVELKNSADVKFALERFEELWQDAVDVSEEYVEVVRRQTWLNDEITPYELYLKFLYEYFKEDINLDEEDADVYLPEGFLDLKYQRQAVVAARKILDAYHGVFIADVVGMGKTFIAALLAQQLPGKILVICPPVLQEYWYETFFDFGVRGFKVESQGKLDHIIKKGYEQFDYVIVDEAHRFRNEVTQGYEKLHQICWGKKLILVSATPLNNTVEDIYSQLKLFQVPRKSTIPGVPNLEKFFNSLKKRLNEYEKDDPEYVEIVKSVSAEVRDKLLKYIMIRRTRAEVMNYFSKDLEKQNLSFPEIDDPMRIIYTFDDHTNTIFNQTVELLKQFTYSRYTPLLYLKKPVTESGLILLQWWGYFRKPK